MQDRPTIARLHQRAHEFAPVHLAMAGDARLMPLQWMCEYAGFINPVTADLHVLGVQVEQLILELPQRRRRINLLQHEVRRVVVEAEIFRRDVAERAPPDDRRSQEVLAARPISSRVKSLSGSSRRRCGCRDPGKGR